MGLMSGVKQTFRVAEPIIDVAAAVVSFLAATGGLSKGGDGKWTVDHERVKEVSPHIMGFTHKETAFSIADAPINIAHRQVLEFRLAQLRRADQDVFLKVMATIPSKDDRAKQMIALAQMRPEAFTDAIRNWRLMQIDTDLLVRIKTGIRQHGEDAWAWLQDTHNWDWLRDQTLLYVQEIDDAAGRAAVRVTKYSNDLDDRIIKQRDARLTPWNRFCRIIGIGGID